MPISETENGQEANILSDPHFSLPDLGLALFLPAYWILRLDVSRDAPEAVIEDFRTPSPAEEYPAI